MAIKERIEWIDLAKGIGIVLVIAGHTIALQYSAPLYTFHMPLFFFLTGLCLSTDTNFISFVRKKSQSILLPWVIFALIGLSVTLLIPEWREALTLKRLLKEIYSSNTNCIQNSSIWYLVCLFVAEIVMFLINKFRDRWKNSLWFYVIFSVFAVIMLYIPRILHLINRVLPLPEGRLPFKMDTAMLAVVFIAIGCWGKTCIKTCIENIQGWMVVLIFVLWIVLAYYNMGTNLNALIYGKSRWLFYPVAFLGIGLTISVSKIIETSKLEWLKRVILFYGRNSLLIFGMQSLFIRLYILAMNHACGLNMVLYANNPWYHQIGAFVVVTFIVSPVVVYGFNLLKIYVCEK